MEDTHNEGAHAARRVGHDLLRPVCECTLPITIVRDSQAMRMICRSVPTPTVLGCRRQHHAALQVKPYTQRTRVRLALHGVLHRVLRAHACEFPVRTLTIELLSVATPA